MVASLLAAERIIAATYAHNQNYYQQSAKRSGSGSARHGRYPSDRAFRSAAAEMAGFVNAATAVKQAAASLSQAFRATGGSTVSDASAAGEAGLARAAGSEEAVKRLKRLVGAYNEMQDRALAGEGYLAHAAAKRGLEQAADGYRAIGIERGPGGGMVLDEEKFEQALGSRFEETRHTVAGPFGLAEWLKRTAEQFDQTAPFAMLNVRNRDLQAYAAYRPVSGLYLQWPASGMLLDASF